MIALCPKLSFNQCRKNDGVWLTCHLLEKLLCPLDLLCRDERLNQAGVDDEARFDFLHIHLIKQTQCTFQISLFRVDLDQNTVSDIRRLYLG